MRVLRLSSWSVLAVVFSCGLMAHWIAPRNFATQDREHVAEGASRHFLLGTDDLGRDRFSRLLYGSGISLLLAPAAAAFSMAVALAMGGAAGLLGGIWDRLLMRFIDIFMSLPWIFLFLIVRAMLPLNISPWSSVAITFAVLGLLGWAHPARIIRSGVLTLRNSDFVMHARAYGCDPARLLWTHVTPNLKPIVLAQFWISIPMFILGEASLGLLGLGVAEPLPSWGSMLRELETPQAVAANPWILAPLFALVVVMVCFQVISPASEAVR